MGWLNLLTHLDFTFYQNQRPHKFADILRVEQENGTHSHMSKDPHHHERKIYLLSSVVRCKYISNKKHKLQNHI